MHDFLHGTMAAPFAHTAVPPAQVLPSLAKHMLVDGFDIIIDLKK
ncbi:MAG: hypothetical protein H6Q30_2869, partial [Bacteroidetes bacterium]|nr:hypothetical protein [Bacteroidota bacterium]